MITVPELVVLPYLMQPHLLVLYSVSEANNRTNSSSDSYIAYVWSEVSGYSKFGTYSGSGSAGNAITLGFKPGLVIIKRYDSTGNWVLFGPSQEVHMVADDAISLDITDRTYTSADGVGGIDFNSNGFTLQDNRTQEMLVVRMFI